MCSKSYFVSDYESISEAINSKRPTIGELGKSLTLPRYHPFKVPEAPVRKSSIDSKSEAHMSIVSFVTFLYS